MNTQQPFNRSADPVAFGVEYNPTYSAFTVGTENGYRIHDTTNGKLLYEREFGGSARFASMRLSSSWVALIGGGDNPAFSPNKVVFWDEDAATTSFKVEFNMLPIKVCLTGSHYAVVFERGVALYALSSQPHKNDDTSRIALFETVPNKHGLCCLGRKKLVLPGRSKGQVQIYNIENGKVSILPAHESSLRMFALNRDETVLATAGDRGTLIKIWYTSQEAAITQFRRGLDQASIFSIGFSPSGDQMAVTSDKATIHVFDMPWKSQPSVGPNASRLSSRPTKATDPVLVPSVRNSASYMGSSPPLSDKLGASPPNPGRYGISPSGEPYRLGTPPSDVSFPMHHDQGWGEISRQQQQSSIRHVYAPSITATEYSSDSSSRPAKSSRKYGNLGNLPLAPRFFKDTYSVMKCNFEIGNEPLHQHLIEHNFQPKGKGVDHIDKLGSSVSSTETVLPQASHKDKEILFWPDSKAPKGQIAWLDEDTLIIVGAGRDARWEKFVLGVDSIGNRGIEKQSWRRYMEDEGVD